MLFYNALITRPFEGSRQSQKFRRNPIEHGPYFFFINQQNEAHTNECNVANFSISFYSLCFTSRVGVIYISII